MLEATPVRDLLLSMSAVVLERIARGGGATRWYYCASNSKLELVEDRLSPGSVVSFYFDGRIRNDAYSPRVSSAIEELLTRNQEVMVGTLGDDNVSINAEFISGPKEFAEFASAIEPSSRVFYGIFPARDNDGVRAVTLILPDADGTVRAHPH